MTPLTLSTEHGVDGTPRVIAAGEIDLSNIRAFDEAMTNACRGHSATIVDMSAVHYLDSAGIKVLFKQANEIDRLELIVHPLLMRVLTITGLSAVANVTARDAADGPGGAGPGRST